MIRDADPTRRNEKTGTALNLIPAMQNSEPSRFFRIGFSAFAFSLRLRASARANSSSSEQFK
jgi:hypothetical protein